MTNTTLIECLNLELFCKIYPSNTIVIEHIKDRTVTIAKLTLFYLAGETSGALIVKGSMRLSSWPTRHINYRYNYISITDHNYVSTASVKDWRQLQAKQPRNINFMQQFVKLLICSRFKLTEHDFRALPNSPIWNEAVINARACNCLSVKVVARAVTL